MTASSESQGSTYRGWSARHTIFALSVATLMSVGMNVKQRDINQKTDRKIEEYHEALDDQLHKLNSYSEMCQSYHEALENERSTIAILHSAIEGKRQLCETLMQQNEDLAAVVSTTQGYTDLTINLLNQRTEEYDRLEKAYADIAAVHSDDEKVMGEMEHASADLQDRVRELERQLREASKRN